mgnify:CR=1 FL=1
MRLTNVSRMALPPGRLLSYGVRPTDRRGCELPISFDQARHVAEGQRPGSWMAVAARLPLGTSADALAAAWLAVVRRHGTFSTVFSHAPDGRPQLHQIAVQPGEWVEHPVPVDADPRQSLRELFDQSCAPFEQPSHRLVMAVPNASEADARPQVIIGSDHTHVDMWSFLVVLRDLFTGLDDLRAGRPPLAETPPAAAFAEHTAALASRPPAAEEVHRRWSQLLEAEQGVMPRFPLPLGDPDFEGESIVEVRDLLDAGQAARFADRAADEGVRSIALALSVLSTVTAELAGAPLRALFPVHSRDEPRGRDSAGWYITNSIIECADPDPQACARSVKEGVILGSHPLAPILAAYGGMPTAPGMFALSWLDTRRLPALPADAEVQYVSAVIHDDGIMVWFVVNDSGLHLRARYPNTPEARWHVGAWLNGVERGLLAEIDQICTSSAA